MMKHMEIKLTNQELENAWDYEKHKVTAMLFADLPVVLDKTLAPGTFKFKISIGPHLTAEIIKNETQTQTEPTEK